MQPETQKFHQKKSEPQFDTWYGLHDIKGEVKHRKAKGPSFQPKEILQKKETR